MTSADLHLTLRRMMASSNGPLAATFHSLQQGKALTGVTQGRALHASRSVPRWAKTGLVKLWFVVLKTGGRITIIPCQRRVSTPHLNAVGSRHSLHRRDPEGVPQSGHNSFVQRLGCGDQGHRRVMIQQSVRQLKQISAGPASGPRPPDVHCRCETHSRSGRTAGAACRAARCRRAGADVRAGMVRHAASRWPCGRLPRHGSSSRPHSPGASAGRFTARARSRPAPARGW